MTEMHRPANVEIAQQIPPIAASLVWLEANRQRLHSKDCLFHRPDARCSCGLHRVLTDLRMSLHDLMVIAGELPDRTLVP